MKPGLSQHLTTLSRKQFVRPADGGMAADDSDAYRFHHILIRDTAYNALLKRARATLHERFVEWAEQVNRERDREQEFEEILGYHLEQAFRYRSELGPIDAEGRAIGARARNGSVARGAVPWPRRPPGSDEPPGASSRLARGPTIRSGSNCWWTSATHSSTGERSPKHLPASTRPRRSRRASGTGGSRHGPS